MRRSAVLVVLAMMASACSAAEAELARMEQLPQIVEIDAEGEESVAYDPAVFVPIDGQQAAPDLFDRPLQDTDTPADTADQDPAEPNTDAEPPDPEEPEPAPENSGVPVVQPTIIQRYPHDGAAFTQGLEFTNGVLIESLGLVGESARRRVEPTTGAVTASARLSAEQFGAGLTVVDNQIIQLTWRAGIAVVADLTTLIELSQFSFEGEGWGLCSLDDGRLVMSNGSGFLTFRDQTTFEPTGELQVTLNGSPVTNLNELECVGTSIYANVWLEDNILEIDATTGTVARVIDASALVPDDLSPDDVLNGIAHRAETDTFFVTGKHWTVMYEVTFG